MELWLRMLVGGAITLAVFIAIAVPTGRLIERHSGYRFASWSWRVVLFIFALMTYIGVVGVNQTLDYATKGTQKGGRHAGGKDAPAAAPDEAPSHGDGAGDGDSISPLGTTTPASGGSGATEVPDPDSATPGAE